MMIRNISLLVLFALPHSPLLAADAPDYLKEVKPLLQARCTSCHGGLQQKFQLRLDTAKSIRIGGVNGPAIMPGKSAESLLIQHARGIQDHAQMPPASEGEHLAAKEIELLARWIDAGALAPNDEAAEPDPRDHWAFRSPKKVAVPAGSTSPNPIDAFLQAEWKQAGLKPQQPADKRLLLRRVYLDLVGLPPTAEQTEAFLKNAAPDAYEKVVKELLASPQYGERWGRHFMDIWRYSDWWGLGAELRNSQRHIWHWRDWIIENVNADSSYAEMIREMLAADELHPTNSEKLRATGFLARSYFLFNRTTWLDETIEHTSKAFLGLTFNCSKCHDHKYDPISQNDYYRLRAFFEPYQVRTDRLADQPDLAKDGIPRVFDCNLDTPTFKHERGDERKPVKDRPLAPGIPKLLEFEPFKIQPVMLPAEAYAPHLRESIFDAQLKILNGQRAEQVMALAAITKEKPEHAVAAKKLAATDSQLSLLRDRQRAERIKYKLEAGDGAEAAKAAAKAEKLAALATAELAVAEAEFAWSQAKAAQKAALETKRKAALTTRDAAKKASETPGDKYTPMRASEKAKESNTENEASRTKPYPATSTGRRTALANWIADARNPLTARVLVNHIWTRHFNTPLVSTVFDFGRKGAKPTHPALLDWLAVEFMEQKWSMKHLHELIVTSQAYRMSSSSAGQKENEKLDPENKLLWRQNSARMQSQVVRDSVLHLAGQLDLQRGGAPVPLNAQEASRRRSLYFFSSHNEHNKFLSQFDDANVLDCYRRSESIVPQQALALANSKLAISTAEAISQKLNERLGKASDEVFAARAFEIMLGSTPTSEELIACQEALADWQQFLKTNKHANPQAKARSNLIAALMNHNDFVTIR